jgi:O-antigen/teichoic acid export membrane protein
MSKSDYGEIRYIIYIATLFSTFIALGLPTTMTRFLAKYRNSPDKKALYFTNIIVIFLITLLLTELFVAIIFWNLLIVTLVVLGYSIPLLYMGIVRGNMEYKKFSIASINRNLIKLFLLFIFFYTIGITNISILLIYSFGGWVAILIIEMIWSSKVNFKSELISKSVMKNLVKFSSPILITTLAFSLLTTIPIIILEWFYDYQTIAIYSTALTLSIVYGFLPTAILTIFMPKIAYYKDKQKRILLFNQTLAFIIIINLILIIFTILIGQWLIEILFTSKYNASYIPLIIVSVAVLFREIRAAFSNFWVGGGKPSISAYSTSIGCIAGIGISLILIPLYGIIGAAIAFTIGWIFSVIVNFYFWQQFKKDIIKLK